MGINIRKVGPNKYFLNVRVRRPGGEDRIRETFEGTKVEAEERYIQIRKEVLEAHSAGFICLFPCHSVRIPIPLLPQGERWLLFDW